jgi:type II secretory pathway pseudopilin PulG
MATNFKQKKGFTLLEMVLYMTLLAVIFLVVINTTLSFKSSYRELGALRLTEHSGIDSMERMTRDIRAASTADTSVSGELTLTATANGNSTTTRFYLQSSVLKVDVNGTYSGPLSVASASVTSLTFNKITNTNSTAVKVDLTIQGTDGPATSTKSYHSTIVLKGS